MERLAGAGRTDGESFEGSHTVFFAGFCHFQLIGLSSPYTAPAARRFGKKVRWQPMEKPETTTARRVRAGVVELSATSRPARALCGASDRRLGKKMGWPTEKSARPWARRAGAGSHAHE